MQCGAVDRAASLTEFSQFPGEEEYLWTPMSYVEPEPEEKQELEMTSFGCVKVIPVRINTNLKSKTVEELEAQRKDLMITTIEFHKRDVTRQLDASTISQGALSKKKRFDSSWNKTVEDVASHIQQQFANVCDSHRNREVQWFNEDHNFKAAIVEILEMKTAALRTYEYFLSSKQNPATVMRTTLKKGDLKWRKQLEKKLLSEDTTEADKKETALMLCSVEGLAFDSKNKSLVHLYDAAAGGNPWHISLLLNAQAFNVDDADSNGYTALMAAAEFGHVDCLQTLLSAKAHVDTQNVAKDKITALFLAAKEGWLNCLTPLYARGKRENATFGVTGKHTALSIAALNGHSDCLKVLVEGAGQHEALSREELDAASAVGLPPLCWAIRQRNTECIKLLVNGKCSGGNSPKVRFLFKLLLD